MQARFSLRIEPVAGNSGFWYLCRGLRGWMALLDNGWTEEQAKGLFDSLGLKGGVPDWKPEQLQKLREWCFTHESDPNTIDGQLEFIGYELCNDYEDIGVALKQSKTVEEARRAVDPYVKALRENREWFHALKSQLGKKD